MTSHEHIRESLSSTSHYPMNSISSQSYQLKSCTNYSASSDRLIDDLVYTLILPNTSLVYFDMHIYIYIYIYIYMSK